MKVLVVDDEKDIRRIVTRYLTAEGFKVDEASNGLEALELSSRFNYHCIILDIMMPDMDGIDVLCKLREVKKTPVILLSSKSEDSDKVLGLGLGADDYVTKPFSSTELVARVKAHIRRYLDTNDATGKQQQVHVGPCIIDPKEYKVYKHGNELDLTPTEFKLFAFLSSNKNQVFTKQQIFNHVWGEYYPGDENTVMVHIRRLREKVEDSPSEPKLIQTVWGIGYKVTDGKR